MPTQSKFSAGQKPFEQFLAQRPPVVRKGMIPVAEPAAVVAPPASSRFMAVGLGLSLMALTTLGVWAWSRR